MIVPSARSSRRMKRFCSRFSPEIAAVETSPSPRQTPGQYAYRKGAGTLVELHTELTLRYFPVSLDLEALRARRQPITVAGRQVVTFSPEDTLLLLSVHGSKHLWIASPVSPISPLLPPARGPIGDPIGRWCSSARGVTAFSACCCWVWDWLCASSTRRRPMEAGALPAARRGTPLQLIEQISRRINPPEKIQVGVLSRFAFRVRMRGPLTEGLPYALRLALMWTEHDRGKRRLPELPRRPPASAPAGGGTDVLADSRIAATCCPVLEVNRNSAAGGRVCSPGRPPRFGAALGYCLRVAALAVTSPHRSPVPWRGDLLL